MLRTRSLLIFVVLAAVSLAALATAPDAADRPANPSDRPAAANRAGARAKSFAPEKLIRAFRGSREDLRLKSLDDAERWHMGDPQLPGALWQAIEPALKVARVPESLLRAIQLYARLDDDNESGRLVAL